MRSAVAFLCVVTALVMAGCQGLPKVLDPSGVDVAVTGLTDQQVMIHYGQGAPFDPDPYLAPNMLLSGHASYVVLRIEINSIRNAFITVNNAEAKDAGGTVVARLSSKRDFIGMLIQQSTDDQLLTQLQVKAERSYFPDGGIEVGPGSRAYAVVLVGNVLTPPLTVTAQVTVDTSEPRAFDFPWSR